MALKKHKLDVAMDQDFCLLGIVTDEPDYKLCWMINQTLDFSFEKLEDLKLFHRKRREEQLFSIFAFEDEDALVTYRIIRNRSEQGYFLDELRNLDFLVHIQGQILTDKIGAFMQVVGGLTTVRMCIPVDLKMIRNKERLLLW